jgi:aldehyde dehydrogenase (NAD+)
MGERIIADSDYLEAIPERISELHKSFQSGHTRSKDHRKAQLQALLKILTEHRDDLCEALKQDLGRDYHSSFAGELGQVDLEIANAMRHLSSWMEPENLPVGFANKAGGGSAKLVPEPLGVVLIMSAWNYPLLTLLQPAVGAIAAGNAVVLKPASLAAKTSEMIAVLLAKYMDPKSVIVIEGGVESATIVLKQKFDKIMYTGGSSVAKIVMTAAAKNLTPVALELGGKNPLIVTENAEKHLKIVARRIAWAKFALNAGQVCLSPDYALVHESLGDKLVEYIKHYIIEFFGVEPKSSEFFSRIINEKHTQRLGKIISSDREFLTIGGNINDNDKYVDPSVLNFKTDKQSFQESKSMTEEIFGPILPVLYYKDLNECIEIINKGEKPLASYVFGSKTDGEVICAKTSSGSLTLNDCVMQKVELGIPFGGVGNSGFGRYNGKYSFETFSHMKPFLKKGFQQDLDARYPPYDEEKKRLFLQLHEVLRGDRGLLSFGIKFLKYNVSHERKRM